MNTNHHIGRVQVLDENGQEFICVDSENGLIRVIPDNELQSETDEDFFQDALSQNNGDVYVSSISLIAEQGVVLALQLALERQRGRHQRRTFQKL